MGTDLFRRTVAYDHDDADMSALMVQVWTPTPWMVDVYTGSLSEPRHMDMMLWCRETFGQEDSPIHGQSGTWKAGRVTICGWTWFGFATEELMRQFLARWPDAEAAWIDAALAELG